MIDKTPIHELIEGVLDRTAAVPGKLYYVNYDVRVTLCVGKHAYGGHSTTTQYHIGPYPKVLAEFLLEHWVPTHNICYSETRGWYSAIMAETIAMKPKKGTVKGLAPTKEQMETLLLSVLVKPLEIYREIQQLK